MAAVMDESATPTTPLPEEKDTIDLTLYVWRQRGPEHAGQLVRYEAPGVSIHMSFLEMLDVVNERLTKDCLLYTSPSPRDGLLSRMPSSA